MYNIHARVKEHLPSVLLTLLSIVQALALELLWSRMGETEALYEPTWSAAVLWAQMAANFLGIVVIWVVYVSSALRFRWLPSTADSVYPFVIGIGEFLLVETSRPGLLGIWFLEMAFIFAIMNWVSHHTMRRARLDGENDEFFSGVAPATWRDFYPAFATVGGLAAAGLCFGLFEVSLVVSLLAVVAVNVLLLLQLYRAAVFWERSMRKRPQ